MSYFSYLPKVEYIDLDDFSSNASDKEITDDALWAIADDLRYRKKKGEFETYL